MKKLKGALIVMFFLSLSFAVGCIGFLPPQSSQNGSVSSTGSIVSNGESSCEHSWEIVRYIIEPTLEEEGLAEVRCKNCGKTEQAKVGYVAQSSSESSITSAMVEASSQSVSSSDSLESSYEASTDSSEDSSEDSSLASAKDSYNGNSAGSVEPPLSSESDNPPDSDEISVDESSVDESSVDESSVDESSVDESSVDESSVDESSSAVEECVHAYDELTKMDGVWVYECTECDFVVPLLSVQDGDSFIEGLVDFAVEVEEGKDPVVLQLSDPQLCSWGSLEKWCYDYISEAVEATNPDLIIVTGDIVYGKFDEDGAVLLDYIEFMESLQIPWAPVFGNHDNECILGVDWQCEQFENAEYCLFEQRNLTGNGNYSVGILQGNELLRVFYMMDSNGCGQPMVDRNDQPGGVREPGKNVVKTTAGFGQDQIDWYTNSITKLKTFAPEVKLSFAYHIQQAIFEKAFAKYEEYNPSNASGSILNNPLNLDTMENADETDFGYLGRKTKGPWDTNFSVWNGMKALGVDSIFVGHEHCNSVSIVYEGVRFQYGQKSSKYDRFNWVLEDGTIQGDYLEKMPAGAHELMGGTVIPISAEDGSIGTGYIYYACDPFNFDPVPFVPSITQGDDRREMPTYDGNATDLGFPEGTETVYKIESAKWAEDDNTAWDNRIIIAKDPSNIYSQFDVVFSVNVSLATLWPGAAGGTLGSYSIQGSTIAPSSDADANRQILVTDKDGNEVTSFAANTLYTICVALSGNELNVQFSAFADATIYVANVIYHNGDAQPEDVVVNGLAITADMLQNADMTLEALLFDSTTAAYKIYSSGQYKIFFDVAQAAANDTFTFTVFIPEDSAGGNGGTGIEFYLRVKDKDNNNPLEDSDGKYIYYSASNGATRGEWKTFTVDISVLGDDCAEFSIMLSADTTIWLRDIAFTSATNTPDPEPNPEPEEVVVNGIEPINPQSGITLTVEALDGVGAYKATASAQGKIYIDPSLVANKSTFTFTAYVSEIAPGNTTAFMLRIKPNDLTEGEVGHIYYTPNLVTPGAWLTFTVDISHFGDACTEFAFIIPAGQTVWFRDITIA